MVQALMSFSVSLNDRKDLSKGLAVNVLALIITAVEGCFFVAWMSLIFSVF